MSKQDPKLYFKRWEFSNRFQLIEKKKDHDNCNFILDSKVTIMSLIVYKHLQNILRMTPQM